MNSPLQVEKTSEQPAIPNYLVWAILTTCFCCQPTGIYSIILSTRVDSFVAADKIEEAQKTSKKVKKWIFISLGAWVLLVSIYLIFTLGVFLLKANESDVNLQKVQQTLQTTNQSR